MVSVIVYCALGQFYLFNYRFIANKRISTVKAGEEKPEESIKVCHDDSTVSGVLDSLQSSIIAS
jgi:hypothetical protein